MMAIHWDAAEKCLYATMVKNEESPDEQLDPLAVEMFGARAGKPAPEWNACLAEARKVLNEATSSRLDLLDAPRARAGARRAGGGTGEVDAALDPPSGCEA